MQALDRYRPAPSQVCPTVYDGGHSEADGLGTAAALRRMKLLPSTSALSYFYQLIRLLAVEAGRVIAPNCNAAAARA